MELELKIKKLEEFFFSSKYCREKNNISKISEKVEKKIEDNLKKINGKMPDMVLSNEFNLKVNLYDFIGGAPSLIFFYRGCWCPYSNINLEHIMNNAHKLKEKGYKIIVISNNFPKEDTSIRERVSLPISTLTDTKSQFVSELGLTYELTEELRSIYRKGGIIPNTGTSKEIIYPTLFLVDSNRIIKDIIIKNEEIYLKDIEDLL